MKRCAVTYGTWRARRQDVHGGSFSNQEEAASNEDNTWNTVPTELSKALTLFVRFLPAHMRTMELLPPAIEQRRVKLL